MNDGLKTAIAVFVVIIVLGIAFAFSSLNTPRSTPTPTASPAPTATPYNEPQITVSGRASSAAIMQPFFSSLIGIQFVDTATGANTSFNFHFPYPPPRNPFGNYSVSLINEHIYAVTVSYYWSPSANAPFWETQADYIGDFTVHAPAGVTAITKDFG
jgi:hypothetical protein